MRPALTKTLIVAALLMICALPSGALMATAFPDLFAHDEALALAGFGLALLAGWLHAVWFELRESELRELRGLCDDEMERCLLRLHVALRERGDRG